jgi:hypothetical protein
MSAGIVTFPLYYGVQVGFEALPSNSTSNPENRMQFLGVEAPVA